MTLNNHAGDVIRISDLLGDGKQGEVYAVRSHPGVVFKKYRPDALRDDASLEPRLAVMVAHPPAQWREPGSGHVIMTWPTDIVTDNGRFAGFLMPAVDMNTTVDLHRVTNPSDRPRADGDTAWLREFTWQYLLRTAMNLAHATHVLHQADVVVGDFNESNVRVTNDARVTLLDCDSMQVTDPDTGRRFYCSLGRGEFTPPELLNADLKTTYRHKSSDLFPLAVHIYQLLLEGEHPFRGVWSGSGEKPHEPQLARDGIWAHRDGGLLSPRPAAIPIDSLLPPDFVALFRRAFEDGATNPSSRPSALEWHQTLRVFEATLTTCAINPAHAYLASCRQCPWCSHAASTGQRPLPALTTAASSTSGVAAAAPSPARPAPARPVPARPVPLPPIPARLASSPAPVTAPARPVTPTPRTGGLPQASPPRPPRPRRRRRRIIIGLSLLAVAGAIAGTVVLLTRPGPRGDSTYVAVSPDGKLIVSASNKTDSVYIWDAASKRLIATLADSQRATDSVNAIALNPDGTMIAVAQANAVRIWNIPDRRVIVTITEAAGASGIAFSPDGKTLAISNGNVQLWDVAGKRVAATLTTVKDSADGGATAAAFSPDGRTLAVSISDNTDQNNNYLAPGIELWDVATRRVTANLKGGTGGGPIAYSRDGRALAATESTIYGDHFSLWDVTGKPRLTGEHSIDSFNPGMHIGYTIDGSLAFSPDGTTLALVNNWPAKSAYLFDVATGQMTTPFTDPNSLAVADLAYTPDGGTLITADGNGNIYFWNLSTRQITATLTTPSS